MIALSVSPAVTRTAMMKRRAGKTMTISVRRDTTVSTQPRKKPAISPMIRPMKTDPIVAKTATSSDVRAP